ncbi:MAG: tyrosine-type recombinase/integrase [Proteobacteria bacterium]|nr:tyrosine-type recombinase/integrase [Pseudomonadota bacterium]
MAEQIVKLLQKQNPDPSYVKKIFQYIREDLDLRGGAVQTKQLPELLTQDELKQYYEAVWNGFNRTHVVLLKLLLFTGIRNTELINLKLNDVDLLQMRIIIRQGKDRYVLFPTSFCDELSQYISIQKKNNCVYLFESNRKSKFTTRWIREIVKKYTIKAGITKRIHPLLFRHQLLTYLTSKGIVDTKIQLVSGHKNLNSLNIYKDLSIEDIEKEYWDAMKDFPIQ